MLVFFSLFYFEDVKVFLNQLSAGAEDGLCKSSKPEYGFGTGFYTSVCLVFTLLWKQVYASRRFSNVKYILHTT